MTVFIALSLAIIAYFSYSASYRLQNQLDETIENEIAGLRLHYNERGARGLLEHVQNRSQQPGAPALLVMNHQGRGLTGNIRTLPPDFLSRDRKKVHPLFYDQASPSGVVESKLAMVRIFDLNNSFYLVIGRDVEEREEFKRLISGFITITFIALVVLSFLSWYLVGRRVLYRIDDISKTSLKIVSGNLSERLNVEGSGDEFDRLAINLNQMLNRIEALMAGLKDVSDNIAHDLKTPLSRMRNKVDLVLSRPDAKRDDLRDALENTILECDYLIRTFDALLQIAHLEAGGKAFDTSEIGISQLVKDISELYEPLVEEAGFSFQTLLPPEELLIQGNRELISQALANILDNAIKYGISSDAEVSCIKIALKRDDKKTELIVSDNGPGISKNEYKKVIKRFARLEPSRQQKGSGLGLSLVNAVAKLHGGSLNFDDNKPGLVVTFSLPN